MEQRLALCGLPGTICIDGGSGGVFDPGLPTIPVNAGGPYSLTDGGSISLSGSATGTETFFDPDFGPWLANQSPGSLAIYEDPDPGNNFSIFSPIVSYAWDFNYQSGEFDTNATGASPTFSGGNRTLGTRTVALLAVDGEGAQGFDTASLTIADDDTQPPTINFSGASGFQDDGDDQVISWNVSDASGLHSVSAKLQVSVGGVGGPWQDVPGFQSSSSAGSFDFNSRGLGIFRIVVTATDNDNDRSGDRSSATEERIVTVLEDDDTTAPSVSFGGASGTPTDAQNQFISWSVSDTSGVQSVSARLQRWNAATSAWQNLSGFHSTSTSGSFDFNSLGLGQFRVEVTATDNDNDWTGDRSTTTRHSGSVTVIDDDVTPPSIVLGGATDTQIVAQHQFFTWNIHDPSGLSSLSVLITRDTGSGPLPIYSTSSQTSGAFDFNFRGVGRFEITVTAADDDDDWEGDQSAEAFASRQVVVAPNDARIWWANRGGTLDGFSAAFGAAAETARRVVDAAIGAWERIITDFNFIGSPNVFVLDVVADDLGDNTAGNASLSRVGIDGRPRDGLIRLNEDLDWFLDPTPGDWSEFTALPDNPFAMFAAAGSPAVGKVDLFTTTAHELLHLLGITTDTRTRLQQDPNAYLTNTHVQDGSVPPGKGTLWRFQGPSVTTLLTSNNGGSTGDDVGRPAHLAAAQQGAVQSAHGVLDLVNPTTFTGLRKLPSNVDALLLKDAYNYEIVMPETFGTAYARLDDSTGELLVTGRIPFDNTAVNNVISIETDGAEIVVHVDPNVDVLGIGPTDGFVSRFDAEDVASIRVISGLYNDTIFVEAAVGVPVDVNGVIGTDSLTVYGTPGDDTIDSSLGVVTVNGVPISYGGIDDLTIDGRGGNDKFTVGGGSTTYLGGPGDDEFTILSTGSDPVLVDGQDGSDTYVIHLDGLNGPLTVSDSSTDSADDDVLTFIGLFTDDLPPITVLGLPFVQAGDNQSALEGGVVSLTTTFTNSDPASTHTAVVDWGDGSPAEAGLVSESLGDGSVAGSHVYADDGTYSVTVTVKDADGDEGVNSFLVSVNNDLPTIVVADQFVDEGAVLDFALLFNDPGTLDTHTATVHWGDGSLTEPLVVTESPFGPPGSTAGLTGEIASTHIYADNGAYIVTVRVEDDDGGVRTETLTVFVSNVAPTVDAGPDLTQIPEGQFISLPPTLFSDPGFDNATAGKMENFTAAIDWGDGNVEPAADITLVETPGGELVLTTGTVAATHAYGDDGVYTVTVTVTDDDGDATSDSFTVEVVNVDPTLDPLAGPTPAPAVRGQTLYFSGTFSDPGFDNPAPLDSAQATLEDFSITIDWGDGDLDAVPAADLVEVPGGEGSLTTGAFDASHVYLQEGLYTVTVTLIDDDDGTAVVTKQVPVAVVALQGGDLAVGGTTEDDHIHFEGDAATGNVSVELNGESLGQFAATRLLAFGQAGDDKIQVNGNVTVDAWLYGDAGDDWLNGGAGNDVLLGGHGDDSLLGGHGRDLLIGGWGADQLVGNAGDDVLIAGTTVYDYDLQSRLKRIHDEAFGALMDEWTSNAAYLMRIARLNGREPGGLNGPFSLSLTTGSVESDPQKDRLTGSAGDDWFFHESEDKATDIRDEIFADEFSYPVV